MPTSPIVTNRLLDPPKGGNASRYDFTLRCVAFLAFTFPPHRSTVRVPCLMRVDWEAHSTEVAALDQAGWLDPSAGPCERGCRTSVLRRCTKAGAYILRAIRPTSAEDPRLNVQRQLSNLHHQFGARVSIGEIWLEQLLITIASRDHRFQSELSRFAGDIREADCVGNREAQA